MTKTTVQEVRPLTAQEAHERFQDQRQRDINRALKPGKLWAYSGWCMSGLFLASSYLIFSFATTYYELWLDLQFELRWIIAAALTAAVLTPALLALMCFGMSKSVTIAARTEFFEFNVTQVVLNALYRFIKGDRESYLKNKGVLEIARDLKHEADESIQVLNELDVLIEDLLHHLDANGHLINLADNRETLAGLSAIIAHLADRRENTPAPREVAQDVGDLRQRLQDAIALNAVPAE